MQEIYDVAIVGGGPAGAMLARELARLAPDLTVLLVDGQTCENPKVCGGLLAPDAQRVFAELGLTLPTALLSDPQIFDVETIDLRLGLRRYYQRHYLNMDRFAFDRWLISLIPPSVEVYAGRCTAIERDGEEFSLTLSGGDGRRWVKARYLVGADGASSPVRRRFLRDRVKKYVAIQQTFPAGDLPLPPYSCIFDPHTSDSCSWTIRKDGMVLYGGAFEATHCRARFEEQKARLEAFLGVRLGEPLKTEACLVTSPRRKRDFCNGDGHVLLVGEAAGFISASSFEGISSAVRSARLLAEAFAEGGAEDRVLAVYRRKTRALRRKLYGKCHKRRVLCSPILRACILRSGVQSMKKLADPAGSHSIRTNL